MRKPYYKYLQKNKVKSRIDKFSAQVYAREVVLV